MWLRRILQAARPWAIVIVIVGVAAIVLDDDPPETEGRSVGLSRHPMTECPFAVPASRVVECLRIQVPSDQVTGRGRTFWLTAAIFKATAGPRATAPIVYLEGGPGGDAGLSPLTVDSWWDYLDRNPWLARRDLIVFAQRGASLSTPSLYCGEAWPVARRALALPTARRESSRSVGMDDAYGNCLNNFLWLWRDAEFGDFTTRHVALDALRLPGLLGYSQFDVLAVSYGTRVALDILRPAPSSVRSVVLDSTLPPQVTSWDDSDAAKATFLDRVIASCARDAGCKDAFPDLDARVGRLIERLDAKPDTIALTVAFDPEPVELRLDGATLRAAIDEAVYDSELILALPAALAAAEAGNQEALRPLLESYVVGTWIYETTGLVRFPYGCSEFVLSDPMTRPGLFERLLWWRYDESDAALCEELGLAAVDDEFVRPVESDVPVLLLAGELDWVTPPAWAEDTAKGLSNGRVVRFPGVGHAVAFTNACAMETAGAFFDDPEHWSEPACLASLPAPFATEP